MTAEMEQRVETAGALRRLIHAFAGRHSDIEAQRELADIANREAARFEQGAPRDRMQIMRELRQEAEARGEEFRLGDPRSAFEDRAVAGRANPTSVEIDVETPEEPSEDIVANVFFRKAFEGPPGRTHGGIVAAAFDDVTGFVIGRLGEPAFTGELTVRFLAPVPIERPLVMRTRLVDRERRKLFITAEAYDGDAVIATCKATYIKVDPSKFAGAPDPR
jgi:acyl-coenzyme A thioesterase PaaI-like protein